MNDKGIDEKKHLKLLKFYKVLGIFFLFSGLIALVFIYLISKKNPEVELISSPIFKFGFVEFFIGMILLALNHYGKDKKF